MKKTKKKYLRKVHATGHKEVFMSRTKAPTVHKSTTGRKYIMVGKGAGKKGLKRKYLRRKK